MSRLHSRGIDSGHAGAAPESSWEDGERQKEENIERNTTGGIGTKKKPDPAFDWVDGWFPK